MKQGTCPLSDARAKTDEPMNLAYLLLGSNIEPETNLPAAVERLRSFGKVAAVSRVWQSKPVGFADQPDFLDAAVLFETELSAAELREGPIAAIEEHLQRVRDPGNVNGPRTIDIDVVLFNRDVGTFGRVQVPDPNITRRAFVAVPLAEIAPDYRHPVDGRTLAEIAASLAAESAGMQLRGDVALMRDEGCGMRDEG
jgi:2-amino-4-hydroxy-6-hydroxymethyldihydropteridine diphosphokinase